ncbi:hypothetical protein L2E82_48183 [Cichorium intybus]|uniref:Uncharacterized protein n=1 Tax=Cichorium intybus TaxID=13427 RepID=A0ACB8YY40_CICIN|nr:hypothetical protein L2E82_48183 [Cichorium intybus]
MLSRRIWLYRYPKLLLRGFGSEFKMNLMCKRANIQISFHGDHEFWYMNPSDYAELATQNRGNGCRQDGRQQESVAAPPPTGRTSVTPEMPNAGAPSSTTRAPPTAVALLQPAPPVCFFPQSQNTPAAPWTNGLLGPSPLPSEPAQYYTSIRLHAYSSPQKSAR